jgi:transcriptional regulator with XRE-family HTH domain
MGYENIRVKNNVMGHTITRRKLQRTVVYVGRARTEPYRKTALGDRLFAFRTEVLKESQQAVADKAGVDREYYMAWESGANSGDSIDGARKIAKGFGVSIVDLLGYLDGEITQPELEAIRMGRRSPRAKDLRKLSERFALPVNDLVELAGEGEGVLDGLKPNVRKAVLGLVHLLGYPIETVCEAASRAFEAKAAEDDAEPEELAAKIRRKLPPRPPSGTHPSSAPKIKVG